ncbi:hypothetical protein [Undibacterium sp. Ren11W]|uniref:hypothetical protein n=1 Tax=Undibacterium sp. Ren11W TaxID=3413045 RepID=UPI003BF22167
MELRFRRKAVIPEKRLPEAERSIETELETELETDFERAGTDEVETIIEHPKKVDGWRSDRQGENCLRPSWLKAQFNENDSHLQVIYIGVQLFPDSAS